MKRLAILLSEKYHYKKYYIGNMVKDKIKKILTNLGPTGQEKLKEIEEKENREKQIRDQHNADKVDIF